jgi:hypothetical protein
VRRIVNGPEDGGQPDKLAKVLEHLRRNSQKGLDEFILDPVGSPFA